MRAAWSLLLLWSAAAAQQNAVDYLAREVGRWPRENHCFSCHNNGDAVRALAAAARRGYAIPKLELADTAGWLSSPAGWDEHHGTAGFDNQMLGHIQFASALADASAAGLVSAGRALEAAADSLLRYQQMDGAWRIDTGGVPGAPATYGTMLATYMARHTLELAGAKRYARPIAGANGWLARSRPESLLDTAVLLLALPGSADIQRRYLDVVISAQTSDGGWGPQVYAPPEPFDTAMVLLALNAVNLPARTGPAMARGRAFLLAQQEPDGSWPETTRPAGAQSYAEHISTTAWATYALLLIDVKRQ